MAKSPRKARDRSTRKSKVRAAGAGPAPPGLWERIPTRAQHAIGIGLLLLVTLAFFWPVTFGGYSLVGSDTIQWRGMTEAMFQYEAETGNRALWAPNGFSGMPGYHLHYPKEVPQLDRVPAFLRNAGWWPGAHFFMMLLGVYLLVVYLSRDPLAGVLASVAFGLTAYIPIILAAGHNTKFVALAFAPWLILAFVYTLRRPPGAGWVRVALGALVFAVVLAMNLRADHVQITYYVVFALGIIWLVEAGGAIRDREWKPLLISTAALAVGGLLALGMVAQPYMAVAEYKEFTIRAAGEGGGLDWTYAMRWSQGFGELITLLIPGAYGSDGMTYWGPKPFTAGPHYMGPMVLVLAGLGLYGVRRRVVLGLGIASGVMVLFSLGEHLAPLNRVMFNVFPLFSSFRVPETWLSVVALCVAVLAGAGLYYMGRREPVVDAVERKTRVATIAVVGMAAFLVLMLLGRDLFFSFESAGELDRIVAAVSAQSGVGADDPRVMQHAVEYLGEVRSERRSMFAGDAMRSLMFLIFGGLLIWLHRTQRIPVWAMQAGMILLVTVDLWGVDRRYFNVDHPSMRSSGEITRAIPQYGVDRYIQAQVEVAGGPGHFRTLPLAMNPFNDGRTPFFYESVGGYHGAKLALYQDYIDDLLFSDEGGFTPHGLDLTSTRFVIFDRPLPGMEVVFEDQQTGLMVLERPDFLPRAWFVEDFVVAEDRETTYGYLLDAGFDLRTTVVLDQKPEGGLRAAPIDTLGTSVELVRFTPREILWTVETERPRLLVTSEVYFPAGWVARIEGDEVPIYRANHFLRAFVVPEGRHHVTMRFEPEVHRRSTRYTAIATAIAYLGLMLVAGLWWYRRGDQE